MIKMEKLILIDFCETITNFQTFDPFIEFVIKETSPLKHSLCCSKISKTFWSILTRIHCKFKKPFYYYKWFIVKMIKGTPETELYKMGREYYLNVIKPNLVPETIELLKDYISENSKLIIVSGGACYYIKYFCEEYGIHDCITTELEVSEGMSTGNILDDCLGNNKITMLQKWVSKQNDIYELNTFITDSKTDLPLLNLVKNKIVISRNNHQPWVTDNMKEIIWFSSNKS